MEFIIHERDGSRIAELLGNATIVASAGDALDLLAEAGTRNIVLKREHLAPDFFRLGTGLAGEILQKFSNYRVRCAIIGDFSQVRSPALHDFILESNETGEIVFVADIDTALALLSKG